MLRFVSGLVRIRRDGGVEVVELHYPERRNAMSSELVRRLCSELASLGAATDVEVSARELRVRTERSDGGKLR